MNVGFPTCGSGPPQGPVRAAVHAAAAVMSPLAVSGGKVVLPVFSLLPVVELGRVDG